MRLLLSSLHAVFLCAERQNSRFLVTIMDVFYCENNGCLQKLSNNEWQYWSINSHRKYYICKIYFKFYIVDNTVNFSWYLLLIWGNNVIIRVDGKYWFFSIYLEVTLFTKQNRMLFKLCFIFGHCQVNAQHMLLTYKYICLCVQYIIE